MLAYITGKDILYKTSYSALPTTFGRLFYWQLIPIFYKEETSNSTYLRPAPFKFHRSPRITFLNFFVCNNLSKKYVKWLVGPYSPAIITIPEKPVNKKTQYIVISNILLEAFYNIFLIYPFFATYFFK